ncbi:MAG TPA: sensor histidine kinase [Solirubrobacteraceae bacterium]|jgi:signal transduction histidine kinase
MAVRARSWFIGVDPLRTDGLVALVLLIAIEVQVWTRAPAEHRVAEALAGAVLAAAVSVRRRWPLGVLVVIAVALTAQNVAGGSVTQHAAATLVALIMVFYAGGAFLAGWRALAALALGLATGLVDVLLTTGSFFDVLFTETLLVLVPWTVGRTLRERGLREHAERDRAERLDATLEQRQTSTALGERARIARELHDVIAHSVSVMVIQAGAARTVIEREPDRADASLRAVERAGREALVEMRRLLGMLDGGEGERPLAPQPGLADLDALVSRTKATGLPTVLRSEGDPSTVAPALDLCAYRIVQEALTNAIKHAGPAHAEVCLRWAPDTLEIEVSDSGRGTARPSTGAAGGHGITGMRERAALHGGTVRAGVVTGGGFSVHARLPLNHEYVR